MSKGSTVAFYARVSSEAQAHAHTIDSQVAALNERIDVHAPDRLARRHAHQILLIEEFRRAGAEVVFLNRSIGDNAEDNLLLQVQGIIAEYERAKLLERVRRGRLHAARSGSAS